MTTLLLYTVCIIQSPPLEWFGHLKLGGGRLRALQLTFPQIFKKLAKKQNSVPSFKEIFLKIWIKEGGTLVKTNYNKGGGLIRVVT